MGTTYLFLKKGLNQGLRAMVRSTTILKGRPEVSPDDEAVQKRGVVRDDDEFPCVLRDPFQALDPDPVHEVKVDLEREAKRPFVDPPAKTGLSRGSTFV